jgi:putative ABC transport system ATP-binding protein
VSVAQAAGPIVRLEKVTRTYPTPAGVFHALREVDLDVQAGEFVAVIGKSGSGKSTLVNMVTGIDRPTAGRVLVAGTEVSKLDENRTAIWRGRNVGVVFQFFQLMPTLTIVDNIMLPMDFCGTYTARERRPKAMELLRLVELEDQAEKLPTELSGGQQQRAAIARALANDPPILTADEPTGNLDSKTADHVFDLFSRMSAQGRTIVMVTHDADLSRRVGRAVMVHDGQIVNEIVNVHPGGAARA